MRANRSSGPSDGGENLSTATETGARTGALRKLGATLPGGWKLMSVCGMGGTSYVFEAVRGDGQRAAIKLLRPELADVASARERLRGELTASEVVRHPGVAMVYGHDVEAEGLPFIVMEFLDGATLGEAARSAGGALPIDTAVSAAAEVLDTLAAAHDCGIVHRDIKPQNIFLPHTGGVKVLDFGIARVRMAVGGGSVTASGAAFGTPAFMAPEQAAGRVHEVDARTDIWAVGATLYALLSGQHVRQGDNINAMLLEAATRPVPALRFAAPHVRDAVGRVIDRALSFEASERWPNARAMREALLRAVAAPAQIPELFYEKTLPEESVRHATGGTSKARSRMGLTAFVVGIVLVPVAAVIATARRSSAPVATSSVKPHNAGSAFPVMSSRELRDIDVRERGETNERVRMTSPAELTTASAPSLSPTASTSRWSRASPSMRGSQPASPSAAGAAGVSRTLVTPDVRRVGSDAVMPAPRDASETTLTPAEHDEAGEHASSASGSDRRELLERRKW